MNPSKLYIAGPMTGYHEFNRKAFEFAANSFSEMGWEVFNPTVEEEPFDLEGKTGNEEISPKMLMEIIKKDVKGLLSCDAIYMLQGWEKSTGARAEHALALWANLEIMYE